MILFYIIFSIIAISYFKGKYFYCMGDEVEFWELAVDSVADKWDCLNFGGEWMRKPYSFDNIYTSMIALFQMTTMQGWAEIMFMALSTTDIDSVAQPLNN